MKTASITMKKRKRPNKLDGLTYYAINYISCYY